ncbi:MAG: DUF454 family protein [Aphanocapsa sp. GSE-SYN-MK-11-07L]|nr:DUF454 family protein [Aphanocapsa sp. GSE-SYN-MK-11-07L]
MFNKEVRNAARMFAGTVLSVVGVVGLVLPLIPGIPFLIAAAACFNAIES